MGRRSGTNQLRNSFSAQKFESCAGIPILSVCLGDVGAILMSPLPRFKLTDSSCHNQPPKASVGVRS